MRCVARAGNTHYNWPVLRKLLYTLLLVIGFTGCASRLPAQVPLVKPIAEDEEVRISREFRRQAKKQLKLVRHPEIERYVDRIGRQLLSPMGPQPFDYRFFVVENSQLNAFAIPGGTIYVHSGLIEKVKSTDELAGVVGHEIVHIKARHIARISGPDPLSLLALLGVFLSGGGAQAQAAGAIGQALAATRQLAYNRQLEQEADALGVKYMADAGYDPKAALAFLRLIDQERVLNPVDLPPYLMTHPLSQERVTRVEAVVHSLRVGATKREATDPIRKIQTLLRLERDEADGVIEQYARLLNQNAKSAEALHMLGLAYQYRSRWKEAREHLERARAADPQSPGIDRDLGRLYTQMSEFGPAHDALERALGAEPKEPLNHLWLGELFEKEGKLSEAVLAFLRAHNLSPLWPEPAQRLGVVYGKMSRLGDAHYYLARSQLLADEDELALANLERALKISGPNTLRGQLIADEIAAIKARRR
ncbi:MAG: M48 family metalloprotease [Deltaproteobacteria bacterium]|nr:M48 family metalloprotease [Deltaproteobacteria bacterium]